MSAQAPLDLSVHFNTASAELDAPALASLKAICESIGDRTPTAVIITGHTDDRGSDAYNLDLSQRRADAVRKALSATCPELATTDIAWKGENRPVASNTNDEGRAMNRRVDVALSFEEEDDDVPTASTAPIYPVIEPLMPLVDKKQERFTVDPSKAIDLRTREGWTVHIDAGAIVDASGRSATGPVDVTCRAFFTPAEAIASGIPMFVGHGDDAGHMESAGMYEVLASKNGQPVQLAPGRRITIQRGMAAQPGPGYNNYMLDPATGQWQEDGPVPASPSISVQEELYSPGTLIANISGIDGIYTDSLAAWWTYQQEMRGTPRMPDTLDFKARQADRRYCLTAACMPMRDEKGSWKGRVFSMDRKDDVPAINLRITRKRAADARRIYFRVMLAKGWLHPEWGVFGQEKQWVYNGPMSRAKFLDSIATKHLYQDIELVATTGSDDGVLRLKSQGEWIELPIDLSTYRHTKADEITWDRQLTTFNKRVANKVRQFNNHLSSQVDGVKRRITREEASAYALARRKMRPDELAMDKAPWIETSRAQYAAYQIRAAAAMQATMASIDPMWVERAKAAEITASFTMSGFGIYNCDQILERQAIEPMVVAVLDENAKPFAWHTAYGVMDGRNAVITYWGNGTGKDDRLRLSRDMSSVVFVGKDNELLVVKRPGQQCDGRASARLQGIRTAQPKTKQELEVLVMR